MCGARGRGSLPEQKLLTIRRLLCTICRPQSSSHHIHLHVDGGNNNQFRIRPIVVDRIKCAPSSSALFVRFIPTSNPPKSVNVFKADPFLGRRRRWSIYSSTTTLLSFNSGLIITTKDFLLLLHHLLSFSRLQCLILLGSCCSCCHFESSK